ncbi:Hpt domain-containing protein [Desulfosarcina sp. OttesenSCG-928-G10]|nr:Hpt domain-containing protein [Desulfosarcina sp. OttesenSCG-928-G10]
MSQLPTSLPGIDVASGVARVVGNEKLYVQMLRRVAGNAPDTIDKVNSALAGGNIQGVRDVAHSIKGAAANLSMLEVADAAGKLEIAAKDNDLAALPACAADFAEAMQKFSAIVAEHVKD